MGKIIAKNTIGDRGIVECTDLSVDINQCIDYFEQKGIKKENIRILIQGSPLAYIDLETFGKLKKQLEILTSKVNAEDQQIQKFAKIILSIRKNIRYNHKLAKELKFTWWNINCEEGLIKGKCTCAGYAAITQLAFRMHGIDAEIAESDIHAWNIIKLGDTWFNWDMTDARI